MGGRPALRRTLPAAKPSGDRVVGKTGRPCGARSGKSPVTRDVDFRRPPVSLTAKDVAEITRLLNESTFDELYLEIDGLKLSLKRDSAAQTESDQSVPAARPPAAPARAAEAIAD